MGFRALAQYFMIQDKNKAMSIKVEMTTMTACATQLQEQGYSENFIITQLGLNAPSVNKTYLPQEIKINSFYRFEGESDPADNAIIYAIETNDGIRGMVIDAYGGPYVSQSVSTFIGEVEKIHKHGTNPAKEALENGLEF